MDYIDFTGLSARIERFNDAVDKTLDGWNEALAWMGAAFAEWAANLRDLIAQISAALRREPPPPWARKKQNRKGPHFARSQNVHLPPPLYVSWQPCGRRG